MAPQAILELVDGKRDMQWCMTARKIARSQLLGTKWVSEATKNAMYQLLQFRGENGTKQFDEEVERQKNLLIREDKIYDVIQKNKQSKTVKDIEDRIFERAQYTTSQRNRKKAREFKEQEQEKRRRDAYVSEEEKKVEYEKEMARRRGFEEPDDKDVLPSITQTKEELRKARQQARKEERKRQAAERKASTQKQVSEY